MYGRAVRAPREWDGTRALQYIGLGFAPWKRSEVMDVVDPHVITLDFYLGKPLPVVHMQIIEVYHTTHARHKSTGKIVLWIFCLMYRSRNIYYVGYTASTLYETSYIFFDAAQYAPTLHI